MKTSCISTDVNMRDTTMTDYDVSRSENGKPECPACEDEMTLSEKIIVDKYSYIGESWDCRNKKCDLNYLPKE